MSDRVSHETECFTHVADAEKIAYQIAAKAAGRRRNVFHGGTLCSHCYLRPPRPGQRTCAECRNALTRDYRARRRDELKRLRALEQDHKLSKGNENGKSEAEGWPSVPKPS